MFEIFDSRNVTDSMDSSMVETAGCWGCALCASCLACLACATCGLCIVPALGQIMIAAAAASVTTSVCMFSSDKDQCAYNVEALKWSL